MEVLKMWRASGVKFWSTGSSILYRVPAGVPVDQIADWLRRDKAEVLGQLAQEDYPRAQELGVPLGQLYYARLCIRNGLFDEYGR